MTATLPRNFFRHAYTRLVASLSRRVGIRHLQAIEDAVQTALLRAVETWPRTGLPDQPEAWLYRVAHREWLNGVSGGKRRAALNEQLELKSVCEPRNDVVLGSEFSDAELRMLFSCCDESLPVEAQLVLALKYLCGFGAREIAQRLFLSEANVHKRISRARARLARTEATVGDPDPTRYAIRLPAVHEVLYVLFTEGYLASDAEHALRRELCEEALRLCRGLLDNAVGQTPATRALGALFCLHLARFSSRLDAGGNLLLLEEQDRADWDGALLADGFQLLAASASGEVLSRYHLEAAIAAEHCLAASFAATRWAVIAENYALLEQLHPTPMNRVNRALAVAEYRGPHAGLELLAALPRSPALENPARENPALENTVWWHAAWGDLYRRAKEPGAAKPHCDAALQRAPNAAIKAALQRRWGGDRG